MSEIHQIRALVEFLELNSFAVKIVADRPETDRYPCGIDLRHPAIGRRIGRSLESLICLSVVSIPIPRDRSQIPEIGRKIGLKYQETLRPSPGIGLNGLVSVSAKPGLGRSDQRPVAW